MAFTSGMNVDVVEAEAKKIQTQSGQLEQLIKAVDAIMNNLDSNWNGADSNKFLADWRGSHKTALRRCVNDLQTISQTALREARDQRNVSN